MTLIALGVSEETFVIVGVTIEDDGRLVVTIESPDDDSTLTLPASAVTPEFRALVAQQQEAAA